jgi:hypothetical protein
MKTESFKVYIKIKETNDLFIDSTTIGVKSDDGWGYYEKVNGTTFEEIIEKDLLRVYMFAKTLEEVRIEKQKFLIKNPKINGNRLVAIIGKSESLIELEITSYGCYLYTSPEFSGTVIIKPIEEVFKQKDEKNLEKYLFNKVIEKLVSKRFLFEVGNYTEYPYFGAVDIKEFLNKEKRGKDIRLLYVPLGNEEYIIDEEQEEKLQKLLEELENY